jgi:hypothetical protein
MGFYNYCLSLGMLFVILGYCLRRRGKLQLPQTAALTMLFTLDFFTHLVGFLLAFTAVLASTVLAPPRRLLAPVLVCIAGLPAVCLAMDYFEQTGFFRSRVSRRLVDHPLGILQGSRTEDEVIKSLEAIDQELFEIQAGASIPFTVFLVPYFTLLGMCSIMDFRRRAQEERSGPGWLMPLLLGLLWLAVYVLIPNHLNFDHGGYIKPRLAMLAPLFWLACLREPAHPLLRIGLRSVVVVLLAANLVLVTRTIRVGNGVVDRYTAGIEAVGRGHCLFVSQPDPQPVPLVNPLLHAANYYCLGKDNVNLNNYEATTLHFPLKFRRGVTRGHGSFLGYASRDSVDTILSWQPSGVRRVAPDDWEEIFAEGPLRIYRRPPR